MKCRKERLSRPTFPAALSITTNGMRSFHVQSRFSCHRAMTVNAQPQGGLSAAPASGEPARCRCASSIAMFVVAGRRAMAAYVVVSRSARLQLLIWNEPLVPGKLATRNEHQLQCRRCKCLTRTLSHRCIGRVVPMALAPHHMPFGPAGTAREPCAQNLVGVLDALRRAPRRGGREKGFG